MKSLDTILTFFVHTLAIFGSMAVPHHFFPGNITAIFFVVMFGMLLVNYHKHPNPEDSVIGMLIASFKKTKEVVVQKTSSRKLVDDIPNPKNPA